MTVDTPTRPPVPLTATKHSVTLIDVRAPWWQTDHVWGVVTLRVDNVLTLTVHVTWHESRGVDVIAPATRDAGRRWRRLWDIAPGPLRDAVEVHALLAIVTEHAAGRLPRPYPRAEAPAFADAARAYGGHPTI